MDLGLSTSSLAPGGNDTLNNDYWKLTYGRVYSILKLAEFNSMNILAVDVDSLILNDPFLDIQYGIKSNTLNDHNTFQKNNYKIGLSVSNIDIALVSDAVEFSLTMGHKSHINGGFLYFPANSSYSLEILSTVHSKSCHPQSNEQLAFTSAIRNMYNIKYKSKFYPRLLPTDKYVNFCNTNCGSKRLEFQSIQSLQDLVALESKYPKNGRCERINRMKWVFFHAACIKWPNDNKLEVAKGKGLVQEAILSWISSSYTSAISSNAS
eukprot:gene4941-6914_t